MASYTAQQLEVLRRQALEIEQAQKNVQAALQQSYQNQLQSLNQRKENDLRQAYIGRQQAMVQLPQQLQQNGITGGPAESSLVRLYRDYGSKRADIDRQYNADYQGVLTKMAQAAAEYQLQRANNSQSYQLAAAAASGGEAAGSGAAPRTANTAGATAITEKTAAVSYQKAPLSALQKAGYSAEEIADLRKRKGSYKSGGVVRTVY